MDKKKCLDCGWVAEVFEFKSDSADLFCPYCHSDWIIDFDPCD